MKKTELVAKREKPLIGVVFIAALLVLLVIGVGGDMNGLFDVLKGFSWSTVGAILFVIGIASLVGLLRY